MTDAGHLENDARRREDKLRKKARLEQYGGRWEVVQQYTWISQFLQKIQLLPPASEPTARDISIEQIES